jgi:hypothetical protein
VDYTSWPEPEYFGGQFASILFPLFCFKSCCDRWCFFSVMDDNANQQQQLPPAPPQPSAPAVSTSNAVQQVPPVMTFHQAPLPAQHISHPNFTPYPPYGSPQQPQCGHPSSVNIHQAPTYGYGPQVSHPYQLAQPSSSLMAPSPYQGSSQHGEFYTLRLSSRRRLWNLLFIGLTMIYFLCWSGVLSCFCLFGCLYWGHLNFYQVLTLTLDFCF